MVYGPEMADLIYVAFASLDGSGAQRDRIALPKKHEDEVETDVELVRRLLADQFPQWAELPIRPVDSY